MRKDCCELLAVPKLNSAAGNSDLYEQHSNTIATMESASQRINLNNNRRSKHTISTFYKYLTVLVIFVACCLSPASCTATSSDVTPLHRSEQFSTEAAAPFDITITSVASHRSYLTVYASLTSASQVTVSCAAFTGSAYNATNTAIVSQNRRISLPNSGTLALNLTALMASTTYSVYCSGLSGSDVSTYGSIQTTRTSATTACCRTVYVSLIVSNMVVGDEGARMAIAVSLDGAPQNDLSVTLKFESIYGSDSSAIIFPAVLDYTSGSSIATQYVAIVPGSTADVAELIVTLSGTQATAYSVVYSGTRQLTVASSLILPPVPAFLQAQFSNDGSYITLAFDSPTDKGGYANTFPCPKLFTFIGAAGAVCVWSDASTVLIYPKYTTPAQSIAVGNSISIVANSTRAQCTSTFTAHECATFKSVSAVSRVVLTAPAPVPPSVVFAMPASIDACSALTVDLTGSSGGAGRPWTSFAFAVHTTAGVTAPALQLQKFLVRNYTLNPPTPVPYNAFEKGQFYTIEAKLCNFLAACTIAVASVNVTTSQATVPVVSILGTASRAVRRNTILSVNGNAYVQPCGGVVNSANLEYTWVMQSVLSGGALASTTLKSVSQSAAVFKLNAYSLEVGTTYQLTLYVRALRSVPVQSSSASIVITVPVGNVVANIAGGAVKYMMVGDSIVLDASRSYDEDKQTVTGAAAGLTFAWGCQQQLPVFTSSTCKLTTSTVRTASVFNVTAEFGALNTTSQFTVTVSSGTGSARRSASATTLVIVSGARMPELSITAGSSGALTNVNTGKSFVLYGSAKIVTPCAARWSVNDATLGLAAVSSTAVSKTLTPVSSAPLAFNLVLNPNALPQRALLVFTLSCGSAATSVSVTTNGAPLPGEFVVTPAAGAELSTVFSYSARQWTDSDLPLTYQFGFVSETSQSNLVVVSKSEFAYTSTTLPAGLISLNQKRNCTLDVFDNMNAVTSDVSIVTVTALTDSEKDAYLLQLLQSNTGTVDSTKNILSVVSTALNAVNCSSAPNCTTLHRAACVRTSGECGACINGFIGDAGDRSTACIPASVASNVVSSCTTSADCPQYTYCDTSSRTCFTPLKRCSQGCSNHGTCIFVSQATSLEVPVCRLANIDCDAICSCASSYSGEFCEISDGSLQTRRAVRSNLIASLGNLTSVDDINAQSVGAWSASLYSLSVHPYELSAEDVKLVAHIANITLSSAISLGIDAYTDMAGVLQATDTVASLMRYNYNPNEYTDVNFGGTRVYTNNTAALTVQTVSSFADLVTQNMVLGQEATSFLYDNFRMSVSLNEVSASNITLRAPDSADENAAGMVPSTASILPYEDTDLPSALAVKVISVPPRSFSPDTEAYVSTPLMLQVSAQGGDVTDPTEFLSTIEFTLQNNEVRRDFVAPEIINVTTVCMAGERGRKVTHICPGSGEHIVHTCTVPGVHVSYCQLPTPSCARLDVNTAELAFVDNCVVTAFNATYTTCSCVLSTSARKLHTLQHQTQQLSPTARQLSSLESNLLDDSGATCMMTSTVYIASDFADTFNAAKGFTSPSDAARVVVVISMMGIIWVSGLAVISYELWNPKKEEVLEKAKEKIEVQQQRIVLNYVESIIPSVFKDSGTTAKRIWAEVVEHHLVFKLISKQSSKKRREIIFKTMTMFTYMLFLIVIFFDVSNPGDDGSCKLRTNADDCLARVSPFDSKQNFCNWNDDTETCTYNSESMSINAMFFLTILTTIMTALATIPLDYFFGIISAPVARNLETNQVVTMYSALSAGVRRASVVGGRVRQATQRIAPAPTPNTSRKTILGMTLSEKVSVVANRDIPEEVVHTGEAARQSIAQVIKKNQAITMQTALSMKSMQARSTKRMSRMQSVRLSQSFNENTNSIVKKYVKEMNHNLEKDGQLHKPHATIPKTGETLSVRQAEPVHFSRAYIQANEAEARYIASVGRVTLIDELLQQRVLMNDEAEETRLFDAQWGIYKDTTPGASDLYRLIPCARRVISVTTFDTDEESVNIAADLQDYSKQHAGLEVLHLFMVDLLGRDTPAAKIFKEKFGEEFEDSHAVQLWQKYLSCAVVLGLNGFFIYYVLLKALQKGYRWQIEFLTCFLLQFAVEILIFETMECVWLNFSVPTFVRRDVEVALDKLRAQVDLVAPTDESKELNLTYLVNAPAHMFVSVKVAKQHPQLLESMIVSCYAHHLPGEICRTWEHYKPYLDEHEPQINEHWSMWGPVMRPVLRGVSLSLQMFITIPYLYQKITIRFVQPLIISGITIGWFYATSSTPAIAGLCAGFVCIAAFLVWRYFEARKEAAKALLAVVPEEEDKFNMHLDLAVPTFVEMDSDNEDANDERSRSCSSSATGRSGSTHHTQTTQNTQGSRLRSTGGNNNTSNNKSLTKTGSKAKPGKSVHSHSQSSGQEAKSVDGSSSAASAHSAQHVHHVHSGHKHTPARARAASSAVHSHSSQSESDELHKPRAASQPSHSSQLSSSVASKQHDEDGGGDGGVGESESEGDMYYHDDCSIPSSGSEMDQYLGVLSDDEEA